MNNKNKVKINIEFLWDSLKEVIKSYISLADMVFVIIAIISYFVSRDLKISGIIIFVSLLYTSCYVIAGYKSQLKRLQSNVSLRVEFRNASMSDTEIDTNYIQQGVESIIKAILINEGKDEKNIKIKIYIPNEIVPTKFKQKEVKQDGIESLNHRNAYVIQMKLDSIQGVMGQSELGSFYFNLPTDRNYKDGYQIRIEFETNNGVSTSGSALNILSSQSPRLVPKKHNSPKIPY